MGIPTNDESAAFDRHWQKLSAERKAKEVELAKQKIREEGILFNVDKVYEQRERDRLYKLKLATLKEKRKLTFQDLIRIV